jgi:5-formyltetrahydrofolate cyclo-ligase
VIEPHDNALTYIATEDELIVTGARQSETGGVDWSKVRADQFADIPFLSELRARMEARK